MRDELSFLRNREEEERRAILTANTKYIEQLLARYPKLKDNYRATATVRKQIISATLNRLRGETLDAEIASLETRLAGLLEEKKALLAQYGIEATSLEPKWRCPSCKDTGLIFQDGGYRPCPCSAERRTRLFRQRANLPPRIAGATFERANFDLYQPNYRAQARKIYSYVRKYCDDIMVNNKGTGLYIHGPTGSGKSHLLGCVANYLLDHMSVRYLVYADFLDALRATFNRYSEDSEQQLMEEVKGVGLLLLDDLGVEKPSEFSLKYLAQIVDYRYRNLKPIVVTSNFTLQELVERAKTDLYGERVVWRLGEICSNILQLKGNLRSIL